MKFRLPFVLSILLLLGFAHALFAEGSDGTPVMSRLIRDYKSWKQLTVESDLLVSEMNRLCERLSKADRLSIEDEETISRWFFSFQNIQK